MKDIVYNLQNIRAPITGIGRYAIELIRAADDAKIPVHAYINSKLHHDVGLSSALKQLETDREAAQSMRSVVGKIPTSRRFYRHLANQRFANAAKLLLSENAVYHDINYSPCPQAKNSLSTIYDLSHIHCPETHPAHRLKYLRSFFESLARKQPPLITISQSVKSDLIKRYGLPHDHVSVTPLAADEAFHAMSRDQFEQSAWQGHLRYKAYVLCVSTLEPRKNLERVIEAYLTLTTQTQKNFPLVIAGASGWKSALLERRISELQKAGSVKKLGYVSSKELPALYSGAAVFMYPSIYEGFGLPLLEAMQSGCPTITSNNGALAELAGEHALQVDPVDIDMMGNKLALMLNDQDLSEHYSQAGVIRARDYSWQKTFDLTHNAIRRL